MMDEIKKTYLIAGDKKWELHQFAKIGRIDSNDIIINEQSISREHAQIVFNGKDYEIRDLNSSNYTFVNNQKIQKTILKNGDIINFGNYKVKFYIEGSPGINKEKASFLKTTRNKIYLLIFIILGFLILFSDSFKNNVGPANIKKDEISYRALAERYLDEYKKEKQEYFLYRALGCYSESSKNSKYREQSIESIEYIFIKILPGLFNKKIVSEKDLLEKAEFFYKKGEKLWEERRFNYGNFRDAVLYIRISKDILMYGYLFHKIENIVFYEKVNNKYQEVNKEYKELVNNLRSSAIVFERKNEYIKALERYDLLLTIIYDRFMPEYKEIKQRYNSLKIKNEEDAKDKKGIF